MSKARCGPCPHGAKVGGNAGRLSITGAQAAGEVTWDESRGGGEDLGRVKMNLHPSRCGKPPKRLGKGGDVLYLDVEGFRTGGWVARRKVAVDASRVLLTSVEIACVQCKRDRWKSQERIRDTFYSLFKKGVTKCHTTSKQWSWDGKQNPHSEPHDLAQWPRPHVVVT